MKKNALLLIVVVLVVGIGLYLRQRAQCAVTLSAQQVAYLRQHYTPEELTYFGQVAFGNDLGTLSPTIHRWSRQRVRVRIMSSCTRAERAEVARVLRDINAISHSTQFMLGSQGEPDLEIHLVPKREMNRLFQGQQISTNGTFGFETSPCGEIEHAPVAVSNGLDLPGWKESVIREEIAQSIGLPKDSDWYAKSVFSSNRQIVIQDVDQTEQLFATEFLPIDQKLIAILYNSGIPLNTTFPDFAAQVLAK